VNQPFNDRRDENPVSDSPRPAPQPQAVRVALPASAPYVTYLIIGVTVLFYFLQLVSAFLPVHPPTIFSDMDWLEYFGARVNQDILNGQLWRLITPVLLHGSPTHIFFNMYALFSLGVSLERYFGHGRFLTLYVLGAFTGNVASFLFTKGAYSVGASTAIFGLIGAEGVFFYQNRRLFGDRARSAIGNIIFIAAFNLIVIGSLPFIDNWGHIGGLIGGLMFTWFAGPLWEVEGIPPALQLVDQREAREQFTGAVVTAVIFGALTVWGFVR
jgi:rhomboid protease GluP